MLGIRLFSLLAFLGILFTFSLNTPVEALGKVIYGVNAGGPYHVDSYGVEYQADSNTEGIDSSFGRRFDIQRIPPHDHILYQTERYSLTNFGYDIPIKDDGKYILVLKFCEVYFQEEGQKVFNVAVNNQIVRAHLDIFKAVGLATAHDEFVEFEVKNKGKTLLMNRQESQIRGGKIQVRFDKGTADNPKINAFYVMKGSLKDVPQLPEIPYARDNMFEEEDEEIALEDHSDDNLRVFSQGTNKWIRSGPPEDDPWELKSNYDKYLPLGIAVGSSLLAFAMVSSILHI